MSKMHTKNCMPVFSAEQKVRPNYGCKEQIKMNYDERNLIFFFVWLERKSVVITKCAGLQTKATMRKPTIHTHTPIGKHTNILFPSSMTKASQLCEKLSRFERDYYNGLIDWNWMYHLRALWFVYLCSAAEIYCIRTMCWRIELNRIK